MNEELTLIIDLVNQACSTRDCEHSDYYLDSMALTVYADAIRYLAKKGAVHIVSDIGRRVIAKWIPTKVEEITK